MEDTDMVSCLLNLNLIYSPYLYHGKLYQSLFPRTNRYQCQTVQPEAAWPPSSGRQEKMHCFRCKHKTTVTHDAKLPPAIFKNAGNFLAMAVTLPDTQEL